MEKLSILTKFDFFNEATESFRNEIEAAAQPAMLNAGAYFYHQGDYCPQFALVGSGNIRVFKLSEQGRQITLYHLQEGETCLVNMLCAFLNEPSPAAAQADSDVEALLIPSPLFREWVRNIEVIRTHVFRRMSSRIVEVMTLVEEVAFRKMDQRIARFLAGHFHDGNGQNQTLTNTHEQIAAELGTAREVVSRVLKEFERVGAIEVGRGRIKLLDRHLLHDLQH